MVERLKEWLGCQAEIEKPAYTLAAPLPSRKMSCVHVKQAYVYACSRGIGILWVWQPGQIRNYDLYGSAASV